MGSTTTHLTEVEQLRAEIARLQAALEDRTGAADPSRNARVGSSGYEGLATNQSTTRGPGGFAYLSEEHQGGKHVGRIKFRQPDDFEGDAEKVETFKTSPHILIL